MSEFESQGVCLQKYILSRREIQMLVSRHDMTDISQSRCKTQREIML